jgi:eukaryotic-like serine/threonine-protein kinase
MPSRTRTFLSSANPAGKTAEGDALLDGRYRIVRLLGEGGMGAVYLASHVGLGRDVAIKFLHAEFISREDIVGRFRREAQAAAAIRHKNIIEVFDVGMSPQGEPFLVIEYLEGESLAGLLKRVGPLGLGAACAVMEPALQALQAAHRKGIVHRDLKPDNIFLAYQEGEPPVVKIIDFGISKFTQGDPDKWRTRTGAVMGTPAYMSPEQARGSSGLDHRTDLYSMGTILFEMLTGALPYAGTNFAEYLSAMLVDEPRPPQSVYADFPIEAEPLVLKALAKNPDQRFQNATEMLDALTALPSYDAGKERLSLLASTLEVRGFAAGDLGQALSKPSRSTGDKATPSGLRGVSTALTQAGAWRWVVLAGVLAALVAGVAVWLRKPTMAPERVPPIASQPVPTRPVAAQPAPSPPPTSPPVPQPTPPGEPAPAPRAAGAPADNDVKPSVASEKKPKKKAHTGIAGQPSTRALPAKAATTPAAADPNAGKRGDKKLRKGARGTEMSEEFE